MSDEQQAVPVAQESGMDRAKARRAERDASGELYVDHSIFVGIEACLTRNGKTIAHVVKYADAVEIAAKFAAVSLPCKSGEGEDHVPDVGKLVRELGSPCENCGKSVEVGQLVIYYDDVGEMHADCENPFSLDYDPPKDPAPEPVVLLGAPMRHVPLALIASTPSEQFAKSSPDAEREVEALRKALEFYADPERDGYRVAVGDYGLSTEEGHIVRDNGNIAREALAATFKIERSTADHSQGVMCGCGGGFNTSEERDRHAARWSCWQPIATADRYGYPSLDLYDPSHKSEYGVSWDGYWNDADGTDHPETGGHWVAAVWCNSCSDWHTTRINPTHWRLRPTAPTGGESALAVLKTRGEA